MGAMNFLEVIDEKDENKVSIRRIRNNSIYERHKTKEFCDNIVGVRPWQIITDSEGEDDEDDLDQLEFYKKKREELFKKEFVDVVGESKPDSGCIHDNLSDLSGDIQLVAKNNDSKKDIFDKKNDVREYLNEFLKEEEGIRKLTIEKTPIEKTPNEKCENFILENCGENPHV